MKRDEVADKLMQLKGDLFAKSEKKEGTPLAVVGNDIEDGRMLPRSSCQRLPTDVCSSADGNDEFSDDEDEDGAELSSSSSSSTSSRTTAITPPPQQQHGRRQCENYPSSMLPVKQVGSIISNRVSADLLFN